MNYIELNYNDANFAAMIWASGDSVTIEFELLEDNYPPDVEEFVKENGICEICDNVCIELIDTESLEKFFKKQETHK